MLQSLVCLNGDVIKRETISSMPAGNAKFLMDSVFELAQRVNRFHLADAEIGLFCAVVIITAGRQKLTVLGLNLYLLQYSVVLKLHPRLWVDEIGKNDFIQ